MPTWLELDQQFRELEPALRFYRLDYHWGAAGVHYRLAGGGSNDDTRRFEALARIAGLKLQELPDGTLHGDAMLRDLPAERWYEALKHHSGAFVHGHVASQHAEDGTFMGHLFSGSIDSPVTASGVLALQLSTVPPATAPAAAADLWSRLHGWLANEREKRGLLWFVTATLAFLVLALLPLCSVAHSVRLN